MVKRSDCRIWFQLHYAHNIACMGQNYSPPICGALRALYHILAPLRFAHDAGVKQIQNSDLRRIKNGR